MRPPIRSARMPSGRRDNAPVKIGMPTRSANWVSLRPNSRWMRTPMMEKIVQTMKHAAKASVLMTSAALRDLMSGDFVADIMRGRLERAFQMAEHEVGANGGQIGRANV